MRDARARLLFCKFNLLPLRRSPCLRRRRILSAELTDNTLLEDTQPHSLIIVKYMFTEFVQLVLRRTVNFVLF